MNIRPRDEGSLGVASLLALALLAMSVPVSLSVGHSIPAILVIAAICVISGLGWRYPVIGGLTALALIFVFQLASHEAPGPAAIGFMFPLASLSNQGRLRAFAALAFASMWALATFSAINGVEGVVAALVFFGCWSAAAFLVGRVLRFWRDRVDRELERQAARVAEERRRLARDLHDTIVYATTTMVMRTEQLRQRPDLLPEVTVELGKIADTGRASTLNLRSMLSLLRESGDMIPGSSLADGTLEVHLQSNVDRLREAGFDANANITGDASLLPPEHADVIAAVAVEASSNIIKHGDRDVPCALLLDVGEHASELAVLNGVAGESAEPDHEPMGLVGMRERVENIRGSFSAGRVGDSFVVEVKLSR